MHKFLRAVGLSDIKKEELEKICKDIEEKPDTIKVAEDSEGNEFAGFEKRLCAYSKKSLWCGRSSGRVVPPLAAGRSPTNDFLSS